MREMQHPKRESHKLVFSLGLGAVVELPRAASFFLRPPMRGGFREGHAKGVGAVTYVGQNTGGIDLDFSSI